MKIKSELLKRAVADIICCRLLDFAELDENKIADTTAITMLDKIRTIIKKDMPDFDTVEEIVKVFDEYKGVGIKDGYKSLAINIVYQDINKTLQDSDVVSAHKAIVDNLITKLGAEIR